MASTKEMQARAKARKQQAQQNLNHFKVTEMLDKMAQVMIKHDPEQDYNQTQMSLDIAKQIVGHYKIGSNFQDMLVFRENFEQGIKRTFGIELATGPSAFLQDQQTAMIQAGVPQQIRVMSGLLDTLITVIAMRSGAVKFM